MQETPPVTAPPGSSEGVSSGAYGDGTAGALRAGAVVLGGTLVVAFANYGFQLITARGLGPGDFGALSSLLALMMIVSLPFGAVQLLAARGVASSKASADEQGVREITATIALATALAALVIGGGIILFSPVIASGLQISGWMPIALTGLVVCLFIFATAPMGAVQGAQRFTTFSIAPVVGGVARLLVVVALLAIGMTLSGVLWACVVGGILGTLVPLWSIRHWLRGAHLQLLRSISKVMPGFWPITIGLIAIAVLPNVDIIIIKGALAPEETGQFGAAGVVAKIALFVPAAIIPVLQSRVSRRSARGQGAGDILWRSTLVTVAFGGAFTIGCLILGDWIISFFFGAAYAEAASILPLYSLAMTLVSVATLQVNYHLTQGRYRIAFIAFAVAVGQAVALILFHTTLREVLIVDIIAASVLIALHEVLVLSTWRGRHRGNPAT